MLTFEQNRLRESSDHHGVMKGLRHLSNYAGGFYSWMSMIRILQIQGQYEIAQNELDDLRSDVLRLGSHSFLVDVEALQAQQWCLVGERENAYRWTKSYQPDGDNRRILAFDPPLLLWARILTQIGTEEDRRRVRVFLASYLEELQETGFDRRRVQVLAHLAAAAASLNEADSAQNYLREAILLTGDSGARRSIIDAGVLLITLLRQLRKEGFEAAAVSDLLAAFATEPQHGMSMDKGTAVDHPDLLTRREEEILQLMKASYTNQEIAEELVLALSTVKRHASNIYMKLDVHTRRQAVREAERLGLL